MLLLEAQDPLGLHSERANPGVRAGGHEHVPDVRRVVGRHMDLVGQFADETDPKQDRRDAPDPALGDSEIRQRAVRKVDLADPRQHLAGGGPSQIHRRELARHVGHIHPPVPRRQPPAEPGIDWLEIARARGDEESRFAETGHRAVVEDDAAVVEHGAIPHPPDSQIAESVRVQPIEELAGVAAANVELAEGADVDQANALADRPALAVDVAVVERPLPVAHVHPDRASIGVAIVEGRAPYRAQVRPGNDR
ncbi:MAG: hypothetical protein L0221_13115 [Chloroflexi bacterium]|nr:hypothetical protein [Chloroflexota bacterium]